MSINEFLPNTFEDFKDWMQANAPGVTFRPPVKTELISNFEAKSGLQIPSELRRILSIADGEARQSAGAIGNWRLMPILEIQAAWGLLTQWNNKGAFSDFTSETSPYLLPVWWSSGWIPFATNDRNGYYCLDTAPPELDRKGQVLLFFQDWPPRPLVAGSLTSWFERIYEDILKNRYEYNETDGFNNEAFLESSLEQKHLLDKINHILIAKKEHNKYNNE